MIKTGIMIALLATTGGAVSFTAQNSQPGDALYPVKAYVHESVDAGFNLEANSAADAEADADVETNSQAAVQGQIDTLMSVVKNTSADLRFEGETSSAVDAKNDTYSNADVSSQADINLESNVGVDTDNVDLESSGALEGSGGVHLGF